MVVIDLAKSRSERVYLMRVILILPALLAYIAQMLPGWRCNNMGLNINSKKSHRTHADKSFLFLDYNLKLAGCAL